MIKKIILAGGCFWITEAVFRRVTGVTKVVSGYAGGAAITPSYEAVSTGRTGHAECVLVEFNDIQTNLKTILDIFFDSHDPTTLDRQGPDIGTQYRSAIYYLSEDDLSVIRQAIIEHERKHPNPIITEVKLVDMTGFYKADMFHQDYYSKNKEVVYSKAIIRPILVKIEKLYGERKSTLLGGSL
jgi:peptide-methionine (S)-S-oxide reductase